MQDSPRKGQERGVKGTGTRKFRTPVPPLIPPPVQSEEHGLGFKSSWLTNLALLHKILSG